MHLAENIDFQSGAIGGLIIGVASSGFLLITGRLTGISGTVENCLVPSDGTKTWNWSYIAGLVTAGLLTHAIHVDSVSTGSHNTGTVETILAGILVGFGTRMGTGCTSGHGISGLPRFSLRSLIAVLTFMGSGALAAYAKHFLSDATLSFLSRPIELPLPNNQLARVYGPAIISYFLLHNMLKARDSTLGKVLKPAAITSYKTYVLDHLSAYAAGLTFGCGLTVSGMCNADRVIKFLDFTGKDGWDPSLMAVMGSGVVFNALSFSALRMIDHQPLTDSVACDHPKAQSMTNCIKVGWVPENTLITEKLVIGSLIFGVGWGLAGICPGPAIVNLGGGSSMAALFIPSLLFGISLHEVFKSLTSVIFGNGEKKSK